MHSAILSLSRYIPGENKRDYKDVNTIEVLFRVIEIILEYFTVQDLQQAAAAYPGVKFRYFGPSEDLPGRHPLEYIPSQ